MRRARTGGTSGNYCRLTRDIFSIGLGMVSENPWTAPVVLLGALVPLITAVNYWKEADFVRHWTPRTQTLHCPADVLVAAQEVAA